MSRVPSEKGTGIVIATVRIAPIEHWCDGVRDEAVRRRVADFCEGLPVQIEIARVTSWGLCDGRVWATTQGTYEEIAGRNNRTPEHAQAGLCEHMLEMD